MEGEIRETGPKMGGLRKELKTVSILAAPMVVATLLEFLMLAVTLMMVGHLGQLSLSAVAIATALTNVTGFSVISGMAGGLETLCGQAYGSKQYQKLGHYTYGAIVSLVLVCIPICILWIFLDKLLILIHQDPSVSHEARKFSVCLIPALFASAILRPIIRHLQTQSLIVPLLWSSFFILCFHIPVTWALIFKLGLGDGGAALGLCLSYWLNVIMLALYIAYSSACETTRMKFSKEAFLVMGQFFRFAVPDAVMVCLKWWSCELIILLSGILPNPKLESSVLAICLNITTLHFAIPFGLGAVVSLNITTLHFAIPFGLGAVVSTRVANELGAGNPQAARVAVWAAMILAVVETVSVSTPLFICRYIVGEAFTEDKQVVNYIAVMTPFVCISIVMDSLQGVLSGVARGSGWQHIGAYVNLGAFYLVGVPVGVILGFVVHLRAKGLWIGIVTGSIVQTTFLSFITAFTNWRKQADKARERMIDEGTSSVETRLN